MVYLVMDRRMEISLGFCSEKNTKNNEANHH